MEGMQAKKLFSVVVPTYNRCRMLRKALDALLDQTLDPDLFEIIVVDDGSTDGTLEVLQSLAYGAPQLRYDHQENSGPGAARNRGIELARGEYVLFVDDDIIADRKLLQEHTRYHSLHPGANEAVLGNVPLAASMPDAWRSRAIWWVSKWQLIAGQDVVDWTYFVTCNISLKRRFLLDEDLSFDGSFPTAAFEDMDLGYRARERGLTIYYNGDAIGYHHMVMDFDAIIRGAYRDGQGLAILHEKHPETSSVLGRDLAVSEGRSLAHLTKDLCKMLVRNRATMPLYCLLTRATERRIQRLAAFCLRQISAHYYRIGYREERAKLHSHDGKNDSD